MKFNLTHFAAASAFVALAGAAAAQTEIKIGYALAPDSHYGVAAQKFEEVVLAETGDQFSFKHFFSKRVYRYNFLWNNYFFNINFSKCNFICPR